MATATLDTGKQSTLGVEVLRCRRCRRSSVHVNLIGITGYIQLVLLPPIVAFFSTGAVILFLSKVLNFARAKHTPCGGARRSVCHKHVALYIFFFSIPDNPCLVLHENGFRYRRRTVLFSKLIAISIGQDDTALSQVARGLGSLMSWHPAGRVAENSQRASVKLIFNDKTSTSMKNVLLENNYDDLMKFFEIIKRDQPHILIAS